VVSSCKTLLVLEPSKAADEFCEVEEKICEADRLVVGIADEEDEDDLLVSVLVRDLEDDKEEESVVT